MADQSKLPLPRPTPETQHFWEGTQAGKLLLQTCADCQNTYFPPRPFCPACASRSVKVVEASGDASLYSYVIHHRPHPAFDGPYSIAVVTLAEGPRMMTNIVDCDPESVTIGMDVTVTFDDVTEDITLPKFRPSTGA